MPALRRSLLIMAVYDLFDVGFIIGVRLAIVVCVFKCLFERLDVALLPVFLESVNVGFETRDSEWEYNVVVDV